MSPLRVLHLCEPVDGGVATHLRALAGAQAAGGRQVGAIVPSRGTELAADLRDLGVRVHTVDMPRGLGLTRADLAAGRAVTRELRSGGWELLHAHDSRAGAIGRLAARRAGVPAVYSAHSFAHLAQRAHGSGPLRYGVTWTLERALARLSAAVVVPSHGLAREAVRSRAVPAGLVEVVHNGYDAPDPAAPDPALAALRAQGPVVGFLSRMTAVKDPLALVEALARLDGRADFRAALVGDGDQAAEVAARVRALGLSERVAVRPFEGPGPALAAFDVYVLPSRFEPFGIGLLEAMGAGLPVVATRVGGIPEVVVDGVTGLLVPPGDPAALATALGRLLGDAGLRARMGEAGRARLAAEFGVGRMAQRTEAVYERAVRRWRGERPGRDAAS